MRPFPLFVRLALIGLVVLLAACSDRTKIDATETLPLADMYDEAKNSLESNNNERAIKYYKRLIARFPFGPLTEQSQLELAFAQYQAKDEEEALSSINRFIKTYPTHKHIDYAYYLRGLINFNREIGLLERYIDRDETRRDLGYARQSFTDFGELVKRFPDSRYALDARQRMVHLRNGLAQAELNVAIYYFRREAYVAVQNRAKYLIETYQQTPQVGDALALLTESYKRLGETKLAEDVERVLKLNYPDHPYLHGSWPARRNRFWQLVPFFGESRQG